MNKDPIHLICCSSQPDFQIKCTKEWHTVRMSDNRPFPKEGEVVYYAFTGGGIFCSFDVELVSCEDCKL